ncbi:DUF4405 domain-containing protein [Nisaea sediminum]|uniref:DUF4405 domain-containing protein n=1 Tax=Nisaea sediminum TaxID=2775867 RepID=UPI0018692CE6|nr:DUF4405 domain-containing protein [Nisaea sediminum]
MTPLFNRYATPLTTGLFAVSAVSGIALFFHWAPAAFHGMHEWLSIALLLPFGLHLWKNWPAFAAYVRRGALTIPLALSVAVAVPFAVPALTGNASGGNPAFKAVSLLTEAPLSDLAPVLKTTPQALRARLESDGFKAASDGATLSQIAADAGSEANRLLFALMTGK